VSDAITRADLRSMSPEQIATAYNEGRLNHLLQPSATSPGPVNDLLKTMTHEQIIEASKHGQFIADLAAERAAAGMTSTNVDVRTSSADLGARGERPARGRDLIAGLTPAQIVQMHRSGALDSFLRGDQTW